MQMFLNSSDVNWLSIWTYELGGRGVVIEEAELLIRDTNVMVNLNMPDVWDVGLYIGWDTVRLLGVSVWISRVQTIIYLDLFNCLNTFLTDDFLCH